MFFAESWVCNQLFHKSFCTTKTLARFWQEQDDPAIRFVVIPEKQSMSHD